MLLIDPTSCLAKQIRDRYLDNKEVCAMDELRLDVLQDRDPSDEVFRQFIEYLFAALNTSPAKLMRQDPRIAAIISGLDDRTWIDLSVQEIAVKVNLSPSRLSHLFKSEAGISLKSYILIRRMEYAYRYVKSGGKITEAAYRAGFSSSAHFAYTCKMFTGISVSDVIKTADF